MWKLLQLWSCVSIAGVVSVPDILFGHRGQTFDIVCRYESVYKSNVKYLCKGECNLINKNVIVQSGSPAKDKRFSLTDDTTNRVFTITITDLRTEDAGQYWCGVRRILPDVYSEIFLQVQQAPASPQTPLPQTTPDSGSIVVIASAGVLVLFLIILIVIIRKKKQTCGPICSSTEGLDLTLRKGDENEYEKRNRTVQLNSNTTQNDNRLAADVLPRPANTDIYYINAAFAAETEKQTPDQIYTELNASRQSNLYHILTADYENQESIHHSIH